MSGWLSGAVSVFTGTAAEESTIEGVATVNSEEEARAAIEETRASIERHLSPEVEAEGEWVEVALDGEEYEGVRLFEHAGDSEVHALRCVGFVEGVSGPQLANLLWESSMERRKTWDPNNSAFEVLEEYTTSSSSPFQLVKALYEVPVPLISDREFLSLRILEYEEGVVTCISCPCNVPSELQPSDTVRGTLVFGLRAFPVKGGTKVVTYAALNMRGSLPAAVVNMGKKNSAKQLAMWRHYEWPDESEITQVIG